MKAIRKWWQADRELSPEERREVLEDLFVFGKQNQTPYLVRMSVLLVLSTIIATSGLLADSAAVVIGAMLVAPLMNPVMAAAGAVVMGWSQRFYSAIWLVLAMGAGALLLSSFITILSPELIFLPEQVLARTRPTFYDLLIALAAGSAGAYTITRKEASAIPGVAVAVALLPPLASAGVLVVAGQYELAVRAVVLFFTNFVAMVLAGALTFIGSGVSPARARKQSADFIKNKLWLFTILVAAICVPLWFYSEKVIFNADYRAAKSEVLQQWLRDNDLELTGVEILVKRKLLYLELAGPNPPSNINRLHDELSEHMRLQGIDGDFTIRYDWTQKVSGTWPMAGDSIEAIADVDARKSGEIFNRDWSWRFTQYDATRAARPESAHDFVVRFDSNGRLSVNAACGAVRGSYTIRGRTVNIEMRKFNWFRCRDEPELEVFLGDMQRATEIFVQDNELQVILSTNSGIMYFDPHQR